MKNSLNLCAELQVDVARLKIFTHSFTGPAAIDRSVAEAAAAAYDAIYNRILLIGADGLWVYPELLESLADALITFPISTVLEKSGFSASDANSLVDSFRGQTESLRGIAEHLKKKNVTSVLLALARHINSAVGIGSAVDEPIYKEVAQLIASGSNRVERQRPACCRKLKRRILSVSKKTLAQSQTEEGHAYARSYTIRQANGSSVGTGSADRSVAGEDPRDDLGLDRCRTERSFGCSAL